MKVIICEDEQNQRQFLQSIIMKYAMFHEPSIEVVLSASCPEEVLTYISNYNGDCYLLDIEFDSSLNGMDLASEIRKQDPFATIIFITTHADKLKLTFTYKLAALDFIVKDEQRNLEERIKEALQAAFEKYQQIGEEDKGRFFQIKIGERIKNINLDDIYYFDTSSQAHKINLHEKNGYYEFYGKLKELENLDERFYRCHKSYIINLQHVKDIDKKKYTVLMTNNSKCHVSFRAMRELQSRMKQFNLN
ncbi:LytR/AlgR family response regulator transcription factor [Priestia filamentosa]|uniref:LytR/AlgR family response regulator transcription factor n=1 Tax=Priestia filamentosa TaxID=1402861 RepID=UPI0002F094B1|nr:LytTR family DNA-binding domain-containing protein [Priestia filamentosa]